MSPSRTTHSELRAPWKRLPRADACNFHHRERATLAYAGTPLCDRCADHLAGPGLGGRG